VFILPRPVKLSASLELNIRSSRLDRRTPVQLVILPQNADHSMRLFQKYTRQLMRYRQLPAAGVLQGWRSWESVPHRKSQPASSAAPSAVRSYRGGAVVCQAFDRCLRRWAPLLLTKGLDRIHLSSSTMSSILYHIYQYLSNCALKPGPDFPQTHLCIVTSASRIQSRGSCTDALAAMLTTP
jgi:hypothetical protein